MLEAAKFGDPVIGVDIHMVLVPAPPSPAPIPTPLPHPFVGVVFDPLGAAIGAALSMAFGGGGPVLINYMPCGNTGTEVKGVPHFPTPPGVSFAPNDIPSNDGTLVFGSQTVSMAGSSIARLTDLVMTCNFPINLPTSVCMAVPMGAPVLVGGPPSMNFFAAITKAIRTKWFSDALHKVLKVAPGSRLSKVICFLTGHPVDVMTGEVLADAIDFELPGPLPLTFERNYYSRNTRVGALGAGWTHPLDLWVDEEDWRLVLRLADGRERYHPRLPRGASLWDDVDRYTLEHTAEGYTLRTADGVTWSFAPIERAPASHSLVRMSDRCDNALSLGYVRGTLATVTDASGRVLRFEHDTERRLTRVEARRGDRWEALARYEYDGTGLLAAVFDPLERATRYEYRGGVLVKETRRDGLSFHFEYDRDHPAGWCTRTWGDGGIYDRRLTYDKHRHVTLVDDARGGRTHYMGDGAGLVTRKIDTAGGVWQYEYDDAFRRTAEVDPTGARTERAYDARGNKVLERDPTGAKTRWTYDDRGERSYTDPCGSVWTRERDARGLLVREVDPTGGAWTLERDARGQVTAMHDPAGRVALFDYDAQGMPAAVTSWSGATTRYEFDDLGRLSRAINARGGATRFVRDECGRVVFVERALGSFALVRDAEGRVTERVDAAGRRTKLAYTGDGWLARREEPDGACARFRYDAEGRPVEVVNELGERYSLEYDLDGRVTREATFHGTATEFRHDRAGRCVETVSSAGARTKLTRDAAGRVTRAEVASREGRAWVEYTYDACGRMVGARNDATAVTLERDALGRLVRERTGDRVVETWYGGDGERNRRRSSLGYEALYAHAPDGGLAALSLDVNREWNNLSAGALSDGPARVREPFHIAIERDALGAEVARRTVTASVRWERDAFGQPTSRQVESAGVPRSAWSLRWASDGALDAIIDAELGPTLFSADTRGRLQSTRTPRGESWRSLDAAGNAYASPTRDDRTFGAGGRTERIGGARLDYDATGRLVTRTLADGKRWSYRWDPFGQLVEVTTPDGSSVRFTYDALGRRVRKERDGAPTEYVWSGHHPLHEVRGERVTTWEVDEYTFVPVARVEGSARHLVVTDALGTPTHLLDERGAVAWSATTDAWGHATEDVARTPCPWRFPGQYEDEETGLHYNRFRYYDPALGTYLSPDPIGLASGHGPYAYVTDPFTTFDPFGLETCNPRNVRFSQDSCAESFKDGGSLFDLAKSLKANPSLVNDIPAIRVVEREVNGVKVLFTLDNRRLAAFRAAKLSEIPIVRATAQEAERDAFKFTTRNNGASITVRMDNGTRRNVW